MTLLRDSRALVTGGGRGLGRAIALTLADHGADVVVADVDGGSAEVTAEEASARGVSGVGIGVDLREAESVEDLLGEVEAEAGPVDILVNNAGIDHTLGVTDLSRRQWEEVIGVNLTAPFLLSRSFFRSRAAAGGHIVNIVSTAAKRSWANASAYHASKRGLLGLSHALHVEGREVGIRVTAVVAGGMRTPFILDRFPDTDPDSLQDPAAVAATVAFVLTVPAGTVIPEVMVVPTRETRM